MSRSVPLGGEPPATPVGDGLPRALSLEGGLAPDEAAERIAGFAAPLGPSLVLLFASPASQLAPVAEALRALLPGSCHLAGCSSAGEITQSGYGQGGLVAIAFPATGFAVETVALAQLSMSGVARWMADLRAASARLSQRGRATMLGLVLADGQSRHENVLAAALDASLPGLPVIGGFGGNGLTFADVLVMHEGQVTSDAAIVCMMATDLPVEELAYAPFSPTEGRCVVTGADPATHTIMELNAEPAAQEYARLAGLDPTRLTPVDFARHPLLLRMGRRNHVRAISGARPDGGLQMLAAIDIGTVLSLGRAEDLLRGFADALDRLARPPALILGFDCILRRLALEEAGLQDEVARLHSRYNIAGFNTYGELHDGMHVNQTFVGMAFLPPDDPPQSGEGGDSIPGAHPVAAA
ncbi:GfdT [Paracoccus suum]|uniref:GfdT n=1 Tax=Paracoccus suum TaxID=2259340 RepID=A0A344PM14_9RHOB|nr:FIST N-terminal domain-containing protein [Paracoccus suum]AXC50419.1 GfdT [Paracoccus suum]